MSSILFSALWCFTWATAQQEPVVTTSIGSIRGLTFQTSSGREFFGFEGIPYAKPPVGKHRFKPAELVVGWTGLWNATSEPNVCMQQPLKTLSPNSQFDVIGSEDCLYLNIYTPKLPSQTDTKLLDVLVFIHGGGFLTGRGTKAGPNYIVDKDIVLVTFNYRLGVLGFLSFEDDAVPGNNGLKDQVLALQWVNEHIVGFGGDPMRITISGASAGGASVHFHMLSSMSKGLFHKAIAGSGSALNPWSVTTSARKDAFRISQALGCPVDDVSLTLQCLRERPAERLVKEVDALKVTGPLTIRQIFSSDVMFPLLFAPVIEQPAVGSFIDRHPLDIIRSKEMNDVPVLFTYDNDEGSVFALWSIKVEEELRQFEEDWDRVLPTVLGYSKSVEPTRAVEISKEIRSHFLGDDQIVDNLTGFAQMFSERLFVDGIQKAAMYHAEYQTSPVYAYKFSYGPEEDMATILKLVSPNKPYKGGAMHTIDSSYALPRLDHQNLPVSSAMSQTMVDYWITFMSEESSDLWLTVESGLPEFTFKDIVAPEPEMNTVKHEVPVGQLFWDSLEIPLKTVQFNNNVNDDQLRK